MDETLSTPPAPYLAPGDAAVSWRSWASVGNLEHLVTHASDLLLVVHHDGFIGYCSPPTRRYVPATGTPVHVASLAHRLDPNDVEPVLEAWSRVQGAPGIVDHVQVRVRRDDGRMRVLAATLSNLSHVDPGPGVVVNARDITDELAVRARFEDHLVRDGLTGLANRPALLDDLRRRSAGPSFALVLVDVIGMSGLNDRIGHLAGDLLLRTLAVRLERDAVPGALVARTSGDEFAIVVPDVETVEDAERAGAVVSAIADEPMVLPGGGTIALQLRVGVAWSAQSDGTPGGLLTDADLALSDLATSHEPGVRVCDDGLRQRRHRRLQLEHGLQRPDVLDQLVLRYQPVVDLRTGRVRGVEALVRWQHPELGWVGPSEFIPVAEHSGVIVPIGRWVLQEATRQLARWRRAGLAEGLCMAVNVSARQLLDVDLPATVAAAVAAAGIAPEHLCLEVTETALADESPATTHVVRELAAIGATIHIDDFGTGYSSFAQLRRFPFHGLKIDRAFVSDLGRDPTTEVLVEGMLSIAHVLHLQVVAEGVETTAQRDVLARLGCTSAQGYLWSRPLPAAEVGTLLTEQAHDREGVVAV